MAKRRKKVESSSDKTPGTTETSPAPQKKMTTTTTTTTKKPKDPNWPVKVAGTDFVLAKEDALICIFDTTRPGQEAPTSKVSLMGGDGRRYRVYKGMLTSKKLFPNWKKYKPPYLIEFKGDPSGKGCVVPGISAR